jgi:hypothetical protein
MPNPHAHESDGDNPMALQTRQLKVADVEDDFWLVVVS